MTRKVFKLLSGFKKKEFAKFEQYLVKHQPKNSDILLRLYSLYRPNFPFQKDFTPPSHQEVLFKLDCSNRALRTLTDLERRLCLLLEDFLILQELKSSTSTRKQLFMRALHHRNLSDLYKKEFEQNLLQAGSTDQQNWESLDHLWHQTNWAYSQPATINQASTDLKKLCDQAIAFNDLRYVITQLQYAADYYSRQVTFNETGEMVSIKPLLEMAGHFARTHPIVKLHLNILELQRNQDFTDAAYLETRQLYFQLFQQLAPKERRPTMAMLINLAPKKLRAGKLAYAKWTWEVLNHGDQQGIIEINGQTPIPTFINGVLLSLMAGEFEANQQFRIKHIPKIRAQQRPEIDLLATCYFHLYNGSTKEAEDAAIRMSQIKNYNRLLLQSISLRIRFERWRLERSKVPASYALDAIRAFKQFCHRNTYNLSEGRKKAYLNLATHLERIHRFLNDPNSRPIDYEKIKTALDQEKNIEAKAWMFWLLDKINP